jgi:hypothetical protein
MDIREAVERVLGRKLAASIISDQGMHWAVMAAMAECKVSHGAAVKAAIVAYNAQLKRKTESGGSRSWKRSLPTSDCCDGPHD